MARSKRPLPTTRGLAYRIVRASHARLADTEAAAAAATATSVLNSPVVTRATTRGGGGQRAAASASPAADLAAAKAAAEVEVSLISEKMMMTAAMAVARDAAATAAPMVAAQGGGLDSSGTAVQGVGKKTPRLLLPLPKKSKPRFPLPIKEDAATAPANATAAADVLEISRQRVVTRSAASVASPSSAATKNPSKNLYNFMFI